MDRISSCSLEQPLARTGADQLSSVPVPPSPPPVASSATRGMFSPFTCRNVPPMISVPASGVSDMYSTWSASLGIGSPRVNVKEPSGNPVVASSRAMPFSFGMPGLISVRKLPPT